MGKKLKGALWGSTSVVVLTLAVGGFLHTTWGKPMLAKVGGCPVGGKPIPVAEVQASTFAAIRDSAGTQPAPVRPALGFKLDETTMDEARAWVKEKNLTCEEIKEKTILRCQNVPNAAMPASYGGETTITELVLGFRVTDYKLYSVDTFRAAQEPEMALKQVQAISTNLKKQLGTPDYETPSLDLPTVRDALYSCRYKFTDTIVDFSSARIPSGIAMRERFLSAKNPS